MSDKLERIVGDASIKRYFDTEYIGAYSLDEGAEPILTIDSLWHGLITLGGGRKEHHVVMKFKEHSVPGVEEVKPLILNATNRKALKKMYGSDSAASLEGRKIQLYIDPHVRDPQDGGFTEGLRIRSKVPKQDAVSTKCTDCGAEIQGAGKHNAQQIAQYTYQKYGKPLCSACATKIKEEQDAQKAAADPLAAASSTKDGDLL